MTASKAILKKSYVHCYEVSLNVCIKSCLLDNKETNIEVFYSNLYGKKEDIFIQDEKEDDVILLDLNREKSLNGNSVKGLLFRYLNSSFLEPGSNFTQYYLVQHGTLYTVSDTICLLPEFHLPLRLFYNYDIRKTCMFWFLISRRNLTKFLW